ncbi:uncharacterized protein [Montipora foliosa]|uniref:uncharacterized protein n=1 Tax=Montipora foliosa TaxID=591990 RepID=UPI0035F11696
MASAPNGQAADQSLGAGTLQGDVVEGRRVVVAEPNAALRGSYASALRAGEPTDEVVVVDPENDLPGRPLTVSFQPRSFVPAHDVFEALRSADIDNSAVSCIQRQSNGSILLTFRRQDFKDAFLQRSTLTVQGLPFALQDVDRPLTYLQVFDAPHELPDLAIINRLSKFCDVISHRRGMFRAEGWENVYDGVRHYRVRIRTPIPNFMRFGKILVHFRYKGQPRTCRHCHQPGHMANVCHTTACFNCDQTGHVSSDCPEPIMCNICKSTEHRAKNCPHSWSRDIPTTDESNDLSDNHPISTPENNSGPETDALPPENSAETSTMDTSPTTTPVNPPDNPTIAADTDDIPDDISHEEAFFSPMESDVEGNNDEQSPILFDSNTASSVSTKIVTNSGRRPANFIEAVVPLRKPTQPTVYSGRSTDTQAEKRENSEPSDGEISPKKTRTNKHKKRK